jgi:hypothetical protein
MDSWLSQHLKQEVLLPGAGAQVVTAFAGNYTNPHALAFVMIKRGEGVT